MARPITTKLSMNGEVVASRPNNRTAIYRELRAGCLRELAPGLYTNNLEEEPEAIVRRNLWRIAAEMFPDAVVVDRTALDHRPAEDGSVFLVADRATDLALPGVVFRPRKGHPAIEGDTPYMGVRMSSRGRALLENMRPSRRRAHVRATYTREELEIYLERQLRAGGGAEVLNEFRDQVKELAPALGMEKEARELSLMIGAMLGTQEDKAMTSAAGRALAQGDGFDTARLDLFEKLRVALAARTFVTIGARPGNDYLPFFEAYFSNFIEGTEFELNEAYEIIFEGVIPEDRPDDAHDILGTFNVVRDPSERKRLARDADDFLERLRYWHSTIMAARPEKRPGEFKTKPNRAGETHFVQPRFVRGTFRRAYEMLQSLTDPLARAIFVMFAVSEVHPFADGNGRVARIAMNAELSAVGQERIIIPTVYRTEYLQALKALSHNDRTEGLVEVLAYAQRYTAAVDFSKYAAAQAMLTRTHAFKDPADAMGNGERLVMP